jgi:predicted enzyme related to lactoylglutathione lyase
MFALKNGVMLGLWSKYTAEPHVEAPAGALEICFPPEDVDSLYEEWGKKHATVAQKPTDMDFGRTFVVLDPDGHRIRAYKLSEANR